MKENVWQCCGQEFSHSEPMVFMVMFEEVRDEDDEDGDIIRVGHANGAYLPPDLELEHISYIKPKNSLL